MGADQEIGQNAPRLQTAILLSADRVALVCASSISPHCFVQFPVNRNAGFSEEIIQKGFLPFGKGQKLCEDGGGDHKPTVVECSIQCRLREQIEGLVFVPEGNKDVSVERGCHEPRISRMCLSTAFLPAATPRVPMPLYFANGLFARTGRTRIPVRSFSKSNLSPGRTPRARRISCGTVICPLLVIRACFFIVAAPLHSLLYHIAPYSVLKLQLVCNSQPWTLRKQMAHLGKSIPDLLEVRPAWIISVPRRAASAAALHRWPDPGALGRRCRRFSSRGRRGEGR